MLTVEKIKQILVHDTLPNTWFPIYEIFNGTEQLFLEHISNDDLIQKFKAECCHAARIFIDPESLQASIKPICESLSDVKKYFHSIDLEYYQTVEFDNRKFAFAPPEFVGVLAENKDGMRDLKILNPTGVVEIFTSLSRLKIKADKTFKS